MKQGIQVRAAGMATLMAGVMLGVGAAHAQDGASRAHVAAVKPPQERVLGEDAEPLGTTLAVKGAVERLAQMYRVDLHKGDTLMTGDRLELPEDAYVQWHQGDHYISLRGPITVALQEDQIEVKRGDGQLRVIARDQLRSVNTLYIDTAADDYQLGYGGVMLQQDEEVVLFGHIQRGHGAQGAELSPADTAFGAGVKHF